MELRHLRYFLAVAEELHFGRAARRLQMTQQPLSRQIQAMETELGIQLFRRSHRRVELTSSGHWLLKEGRRILADIDQTLDTLKRIDQGKIGQLRLCFSPFALYGLLPTLIKRFRVLYPEVELTLQELCTEDQVEALCTRQMDLGLLHPPIRHPALQVQSLSSDDFILALPHNHSLAGRETISLASVAKDPWILHPRTEGPVLYDQIISLFQSVGSSPEIIQQVTQPQTVLGLVSAGIGLALVPACLQNLQRTGVVYKPLVEVTPKLESALAYRADAISPPLLSLLSVSQDLEASPIEALPIEALPIEALPIEAPPIED